VLIINFYCFCCHSHSGSCVLQHIHVSLTAESSGVDFWFLGE
jgi:hypothetical protein